ncbi:MAG: type II secretion system protein GspC [Magnetococcus sp. WYHC-3]
MGWRRSPWGRWLLLAVVVAAAAVAAELTWRGVQAWMPVATSLPSQPSAHSAPAANTAAAAVRPDTGANVALARRLAALPLFGVPAPKVAPVAAPALATGTAAPETRLNFQLLGVLADASQPQAGIALINSPKDGELSYAVGENISQQATLRQVYHDRVILERGGHMETLKMPEDLLALEMTTDKAAEFQTSSARNPQEARDIGERLLTLREEFRRSPDELLRKVRIMPQYDDGRMSGFKLQAVSDPEFLVGLGLQNGDVVTGINGIVLDSAMQGMKALSQLDQATSMQLDILRDGRQESLVVTVPER